MKNLTEHITELDVLMKAKGYEGHFLCNSAHPGKMKESLHAHLRETLHGQTHVPPFYLSTYSHWKDEERPHVKCDFKMNYNSTLGFRIEKMEVTRANCYGMIKNIELSPNTKEDVPTREKVNALVGQKKRSLKI